MLYASVLPFLINVWLLGSFFFPLGMVIHVFKHGLINFESFLHVYDLKGVINTLYRLQFVLQIDK